MVRNGFSFPGFLPSIGTRATWDLARIVHRGTPGGYLSCDIKRSMLLVRSPWRNVKMVRVLCVSCGSERKQFEHVCSNCGSVFEIKPDWKYRGTYREDFPYVRNWVSLGEAETPLVDHGKMLLKLDYFQPTFSYKDRGSRVLVSRAADVLNKGQDINEDSSGNAGASVSAYGKAAGFKVHIFASEGAIESKLKQIRAYGASVTQVRGSRENVTEAAIKAPGTYMGHSYIPEFRDGIRSLAYELFRQTGGKIPDVIYVPLSAGTLLLGVHSGFTNLLDSGEITQMPSIVGVQPQGVDPICAQIKGAAYDPNNGITSIADALVTKKPVLRKLVISALSGSGTCVPVTDAEIMESWKDLSTSGYLVEHSSAAALAGYRKLRRGERPAIILTGNGLKSI